MVIKVLLNADEHKALKVLAMNEYRKTNAQAAVIIRRELERRGLISVKDEDDSVATFEVGHE